MRLLSISISHHKVFGSKRIDFFGKSEALPSGNKRTRYPGISLEFDQSIGANRYTFIIGENGAGKSLLFNTITDYLDWNASATPDIKERLSQFRDLNPRKRSQTFLRDYDSAFYDLLYLGVPMSFPDVDILKETETQVVRISSAFEESKPHKNPRIRSFDFAEEIKKTKALFLKALSRFWHKNELSLLETHISKRGTWSVRISLAAIASGDIDDKTTTYLLKSEHGVNVVSMLDLVRTIASMESNTFKYDSLSMQQQLVFDEVFENDDFLKLFLSSSLPVVQLFTAILQGSLVKLIEELLANKSDSRGIEKSLNVRVKKGADLTLVDSDPSILTDFDLQVLTLFESL